MSVKAVTKYQISQYIKSVRAYYTVVLTVIAVSGILSTASSKFSFIGMGSIEGSAIIFLFVLGLNSFKETFLMILQNGSTRKAMFIGRLITAFVASAFMAIFDRLLVNLVELVNNVNERFSIMGMYEMIFDKRAESLNKVAMNLEAVLITIGLYLAAMMMGYFITTAYYRMNRVLKVAVSIGVPTSIFILFPLLDAAVFKGKLTVTFIKIQELVFGGKAGNSYNLLLSCMMFVIVAIGLSWLLIRKAVEKN